jgi:hypothetical protein
MSQELICQTLYSMQSFPALREPCTKLSFNCSPGDGGDLAKDEADF